MSLTSKDFVQRLRLPAYVITTYIAIGAFVEILVAGMPILPHEIRWRLAFEGLVATSSGSVLLALLLFTAFAWAASDRIALAVGFAYSLIAAVGYLCCSAIFLLDSLQLKPQIQPDQLSRYNAGLAWNLGRLAFSAAMFLLFSGITFRAFRSLGRTVDRGVGGPASNIVVGNPQSSARRERVNA